MKAAQSLLAILCATGASATWCKFFYDSDCQQSANGDTWFDCANPNRFGTGGGFAECQRTSGNSQTCHIERYSAQSGGQALGGIDVNPTTSTCVNVDGAGPWIGLSFD